MLKAYKFRLMPNKSQSELLEKHFGATRFLYNHFLGLSKDKVLTKKQMQDSLKDMKMVDDWIWLKELNSQSLQVATHNLDNSFKRFFKKQGKYPTFKSRKHTHQSFSVPQSVKIIDRKLSIPKFTKAPIKMKLHREIPKSATIKNATVSRHNNKYFVSILIDDNIEKPEKVKVLSSVGIDMGLSDFAILSNGTKHDNQRFTKRYENKLAKLQRQLSKKKKGSNNRNKLKLKVQKVHDKISNSRKDFMHKLTNQIINDFDVICLETLKSSNMMKNKRLSKAIADVSWFEFVRQLEYKADWNGKYISKISQWFPSSKICSCCGAKVNKLPLSARTWECKECDVTHDRDINASKNVQRQGLALLHVEYPLIGFGINYQTSHGMLKHEAPTKLALAS